ncbi:hypothetical protein, partial [Mesorhizobium sp. M8A.F.Ca.ET.167.01.1.1]|uniref:hypothetical protein n=1 Tax=Mesorhizobium sp. M8A.F.Ca.ET.167.01.1.1 TaxID=2563961 RepID=UPI001AEDEBE7
MAAATPFSILPHTQGEKPVSVRNACAGDAAADNSMSLENDMRKIVLAWLGMLLVTLPAMAR